MATIKAQNNQRNAANTAWDVIHHETEASVVLMDDGATKLSDRLKIQTAAGTATAITLTGVELVNGFQLTFVVLSSNSGAATTINSKPLYKPGTTVAPKLIAGKAATVWYSSVGGCFFIKASAEGTAIAGDVLAGKTFSNDDDVGLIGTLNLSELISGNIKKGITINGISGSLPFLPKEYQGKRLSIEVRMDTVNQYGPQYQGQVNITADGNTVFFTSLTPKVVYKYDCLLATLTNLGAPTANQPCCIKCNDDGSIIYAQDSTTGVIYKFENATWASTGQTAQLVDYRFGQSFGINADGSEIYYISTDMTTLKKWIKSSNTVSSILVTTGLAGGRSGVQWVDDNSVWLAKSATLIKVSLSTGTILITTASFGILGATAMERRSGVSIAGVMAYNTTGSTPMAGYINSAGILTALYSGPGYDSVGKDRTGRYTAVQYSTIFYLYEMSASTSMFAALPDGSLFGALALTENFHRSIGSSSRLFGYYPYAIN